MKTFLYFALFMVLAILVLFLAIVLGNVGAWYFAWLLGTVMMVLVAAGGGALLDAQEEHLRAEAAKTAANEARGKSA